MKNSPIQSMTNAYCVKGQNVIVTGGNRGIGFGISNAFAQGGANVAILCRNKEGGDKAAEELKKYGTNIFCVACDVSSFDSVKAAVAEVMKTFDNVDTLVNNAGVTTNGKFVEDQDLQEWHRVLNINLNGPAYMTYAVAPLMIKADKGGSIINISSIGGFALGGARHHYIVPYRTAKAALNMFSKNMACELGDHGIRVNVIAPGPFHSDLDAQLPPGEPEKIEANMPMHRFGDPLELGAYCVFLSSPAGNMITGTVCVHDGGMSMGS